MNKKTRILILALFVPALFGSVFAQTGSEQRVLELINGLRQSHGMAPYIWHDTLAAVARAHSEDMLRNNSVSSTGSDGSTSSQMIRRGGITNSTGQNTLVYGGGNTPEQRVTAWKGSSASVILHEGRSHIGIGIVQRPAGSGANSSAYWTLMVIEIPLELTPSEIRELELGVLEFTNIERAKYGLPPLLWHDSLAAAARGHSENLMRNNMTGHTGSDGSTVRERIERLGITNTRFRAENCAYGQRTPEAVVATWMNSPGHRANILSESPTHLGVGFVQRADGVTAQYATYWTQNFGAFR